MVSNVPPLVNLSADVVVAQVIEQDPRGVIKQLKAAKPNLMRTEAVTSALAEKKDKPAQQVVIDDDVPVACLYVPEEREGSAYRVTSLDKLGPKIRDVLRTLLDDLAGNNHNGKLPCMDDGSVKLVHQGGDHVDMYEETYEYDMEDLLGYTGEDGEDRRQRLVAAGKDEDEICDELRSLYHSMAMEMFDAWCLGESGPWKPSKKAKRARYAEKPVVTIVYVA